MKKTFYFTILFIGTIFAMAFKPVREDVYTIDASKSTIAWSAKKVGGGHIGTLKIANGSLVYDGKSLQKGMFVMDMASITSDNEKLTPHLKSPDFFSTEKNPSSKFEISKVSPAGKDRVNITGNLTIKGITSPLTFAATVKQEKGIVVAVASGVKVDRTKYDIKFRSKTFFGDIGDKAIDDEFELNINLTAKKG